MKPMQNLTVTRRAKSGLHKHIMGHYPPFVHLCVFAFVKEGTHKSARYADYPTLYAGYLLV